MEVLSQVSILRRKVHIHAVREGWEFIIQIRLQSWTHHGEAGECIIICQCLRSLEGVLLIRSSGNVTVAVFVFWGAETPRASLELLIPIA